MFFYYRLCVSALHFNENGRRHQAVTKEGASQWQLSFPKGKKGEHAVVKPHKTPITYGMFVLFFCKYRNKEKLNNMFIQSFSNFR